jgi:hypothetical protein
MTSESGDALGLLFLAIWAITLFCLSDLFTKSSINTTLSPTSSPTSFPSNLRTEGFEKICSNTVSFEVSTSLNLSATLFLENNKNISFLNVQETVIDSNGYSYSLELETNPKTLIIQDNENNSTVVELSSVFCNGSKRSP